MARVVKEEEYTSKRNEILDAVQRLVYSKGFTQMTIQDILDELRISKGAFYHYFDSKQALLEALVERAQNAAMVIPQTIVEDGSLSALEKLNRLFAQISQWKTDQKEYMIALLRAWYADENALFRQKITESTLHAFAPVLVKIVRQGIQEGILATPFPDQIGNVMLSLFAGMADSVATAFFTIYENQTKPGHLERVREFERVIAAHNDAFERILGAPSGSLTLFDAGLLVSWFTPPAGQPDTVP